MNFEGLKEARDLLRIRDYRLLLISNPLMFAGMQVRNMSQSWLVLEETGSSVWVGLVAAMPAVGIVTLGLFAGAIADRSNRRKMLYQSKIVVALLAFITAFLVSSGLIEMWHMMVLGLAAGLTFAFMAPAASMMPMDVVGRERLMPALTLNNALSQMFNIVGPALGGIYLALFGLNTIFYVLGAIYLAAAFANWLLHTNPVPKSEHAGEPALTQIKLGFKYIWVTPQVRWLTIFATVSIWVGGLPAVIPVLVREELGVPVDLQEVAFGGVLASSGAGNILGLITLIGIGTVKNKGRMIMIAAVAMTAGMIVMGLAPNVYVAGVGAFLTGIAGALFTTSVGTLMQAGVEESMRGRVSSVFQITLQLFAVGLVLGGLMTAWIGAGATITVFGVLIGLMSLLVFVKSPELRNAT